MTRRWFAAIAGAFALVAPVSPADAAVPAVRGHTVVEARTTAKTTVYVPTRSRVTATVEGTGRVVGVILRERHAQPEEAGTIRALGGTYAWGHEIRKGLYSLYVLADGAPVRVTLRFAKLSGSVSLTATRPVATGVVPFVTSVGAPAAWSAGAAVRPTGPAKMFTVASWRQDESLVAGSGSCWYDGSEGVEALGDYRWLPGCPFATSGGFNEVRNPASPPGPTVRGGAHRHVGSSTAMEAGEYGLGLWVNAQNVRDTAGLAVWVAY